MQKKPVQEMFWESGAFRLGFLPFGGAVTRLEWTRPDGVSPVDLLRPSDQSALESGNPSYLGCFPMVPFANRIAFAQFEFDHRPISVPVNRSSGPHAIHGFSHREDWQITQNDDVALRLETRHADIHKNGFDYMAWQELRVCDGALQWELGVKHMGQGAMPYGIGLHPWFRATEDVTLSFDAEGCFNADDDVLPVAAAVVDLGRDFSRAKMARHHRGLDTHYSGWDGTARLDWPEDGVALTMSSSDSLRNLQVYVPKDGGAVCLEPVSHVPNVHNRADFKAFGDVVVLANGQALAGTMTLTPELLSEA
ncbi:aldose 1-epimerase [Thalassospira mesophila]|uniref:aldose 1-epimerase n=1 Tax=Thalassospira mesophila TaxID=1293891 RepID=UPI001302CB85|nr:aldose 1-epimerase [Thalassospira mesophila]